MTTTEHNWKAIIKLDIEIDKIQECPMFHARRAEYDSKVDRWIELAELLGTDADGVKIKRGRPAITRTQGILF